MWTRVQNFILSEDLFNAMYAHANSAYPRECVGFLVSPQDKPEHIVTMPLQAVATASKVAVPVEEVIRYAYELERRKMFVNATYHSHPSGSLLPSTADNQFRMWSDTMLILARTGVSWDAIAYRAGCYS